MYKIYFILIISFSSVFAESMYQGLCIDTFRFNSLNNKLYIQYTNTSNIFEIPYEESIYNEMINNYNKFQYEEDSNLCYLKNTTLTLGMTSEQFNFMMALTGLLSGFMVSNLLLRKF